MKQITAPWTYLKNRLSLLVTFENAFTQKIGPSYSPDGPMLEFEVLGDRKNFIDLQRTRMEIVARIVRNNGTVLRTHATEAANRDTPYFNNTPLSGPTVFYLPSSKAETIPITNEKEKLIYSAAYGTIDT